MRLIHFKDRDIYAKFERILFFVLVLAIFLYLIIRSALVDLCNDESHTFISFVHAEMFIPFIEGTLVSANNHILNTVLSWLIYKAFGISEWALRLPNVLSFLLYAWAIFHIGQRLRQIPLRWFFWTLMLGAHYFIEFFAYSRGYGLGMAFLAASIYHLIRAEEDITNTFRYLNWSMGMLILAVLSNLNLLITFFIWIALVHRFFLFPLHWKKLKQFYLRLAIPLIFFIGWSFTLRAHQELYYGQSDILGTFHSLVSRFSAHNDLNSTFWIVTPFIIFSLIIGFFLTIRKISRSLNPLSIFYSFFLLNLLAPFLLNIIMDVKYPSDRTSLHWYFLFAGMLPFLIQEIRGRWKVIAFLISAFFCFPIFAFTLQSLNLYHFTDPVWRKEQITDDLYFHILKLDQNENFLNSLQSDNHFYIFNLAFKNLKYDKPVNLCGAFSSQHPMYIADLVIIDTSHYPDFNNSYKEVFYDAPSQLLLMQRQPIMQKQLVYDTLHNNDITSSRAFTPLADIKLADSLQGHPFRLDYELSITSDRAPLVGLITIEIRDNEDNILWYKQQRLDYHYTYFEGQPMQFSIVHDHLPKKTTELRTYFWNAYGESFILNSCHVKFYKLKEPQICL